VILCPYGTEDKYLTPYEEPVFAPAQESIMKSLVDAGVLDAADALLKLRNYQMQEERQKRQRTK
jgi:hypothetical protein